MVVALYVVISGGGPEMVVLVEVAQNNGVGSGVGGGGSELCVLVEVTIVVVVRGGTCC